MGSVWVVFRNSGDDNWWKKFTKPGFSHVFIVESACEDYFWLITEPISSHTQHIMINKVSFPTVEGLCATEINGEYTILKIERKIDNAGRTFTLSLNTCVDTVKRILGIRNPFIITPYQLYKYLRNI